MVEGGAVASPLGRCRRQGVPHVQHQGGLQDAQDQRDQDEHDQHEVHDGRPVVAAAGPGHQPVMPLSASETSVLSWVFASV